MNENNINEVEHTLFLEKLMLSELLSLTISDLPPQFSDDLFKINQLVQNLVNDFYNDVIMWGNREIEFGVFVYGRDLCVFISGGYPFLGHVSWSIDLDDDNSYDFLRDLNAWCLDYESNIFWLFDNYKNYFKPLFELLDFLKFETKSLKSDLTELFIHMDNKVEHSLDIGPLEIIVCEETDMLRFIHHPSNLCIHFRRNSLFVSIYDKDYEDDCFEIDRHLENFWMEFEIKMKAMIKNNRNIDIDKLEDFFTLEEMLKI